MMKEAIARDVEGHQLWLIWRPETAILEYEATPRRIAFGSNFQAMDVSEVTPI
jgi:hypothetical protein